VQTTKEASHIVFLGIVISVLPITSTLVIKLFADHVDNFYLDSEMGNDEHTEMQLKFNHSPNHSVLETTAQVGGAGLNLTAANHAQITEQFLAFNEQ
jgi:hypothetical protein